VTDRVLLLTDPAMERHPAPHDHVERPARLEATADGVAHGARLAGAELERRAPRPAPDASLERVHSVAYLAALARAEEQGGGWLDPDTVLGQGSLMAARLAGGATLEAALAVARGEAALAFAVVRPPGHHATTARAAGFCLINNVAVAVGELRATGVAKRIAIVDWDVHHGDGTQALFEADPDLWYGSTHQWPFYPGTGAPDERGSGSARGTKHNVPLAAGAGDAEFAGAWRGRLLPALEDFAPEAICISAGYDAHRDDLLGGLRVTEAGFRTVAAEIGRVARRLHLPGVALTLEGGYDLDALRGCAADTVSGLLDGLHHA
jgi:acetoin utilization deacetylase AcuC-like enzyme